MSKNVLVVIIFALLTFGGFMVWLNDSLSAVNDRLLESCPKPAVTPEVREEFYFPPGKPVFSVMVSK